MYYTKQELSNNINDILKNKNIEINFLSKNVNETKWLAFNISKMLKKNDIVVLNGELGSGKTAFMQGVSKFFNLEDQICSPTFTIVNEYSTPLGYPIYHFDVYRLENEIDFIDQIGTDYFQNGICFIEWGNIIKKILPENTIYIDIAKDKEEYDTRHIHIWRK